MIQGPPTRVLQPQMVPYLYSLPDYAPTTEAYNDYEKLITLFLIISPCKGD